MSGEVYILEVNSFCSFGPLSLMTKLADKQGIRPGQLYAAMVNNVIRRSRKSQEAELSVIAGWMFWMILLKILLCLILNIMICTLLCCWSFAENLFLYKTSLLINILEQSHLPTIYISNMEDNCKVLDRIKDCQFCCFSCLST